MNTMEWIPVQDRLPEHGDTVIITFTTDDSYDRNGTNLDYIVCEGVYNDYGGYLSLPGNLPGGFDTYNDWNEGQPIEILAWMPMPEPYKESEL